MEKLIKTIIILGIIIGFPMLADFISNLITMDMILKCVYLTLGLVLIKFRKEVR